MSRTAPEASTLPDCFPRVSGDEPLKVIPDLKATSFSPRERG